jgi:hypothetical protein
MKRTVISVGAIVVGVWAVPVTAQVNMQYGGEANGDIPVNIRASRMVK